MSNPVIVKNNFLRKLLPGEKELGMQHLNIDSSKISDTTFLWPVPSSSSTTPCTICVMKYRQCLYDPAGDWRRKAHTTELLNFRVALCPIAANLYFLGMPSSWKSSPIHN
ncbi:uncharacterized protein N7446_002584 [Penicillium canescens]|uniref:Uncharacterized protein n=1 Tax=Penicillium canescens TaxID=5083 RepID=A0AAD6IF06_PENCN|nr:uncharacterized protein N7446_002584 [Penicillium canescens]KAJ6044391.1 hypothetical protein N7460_005746 [Penicillium canescens]KAJ6055860.1 hypothetical protein N7444_004958 [Penicillium canescens]KAJ6074807.1 hypothetical protein N7446_002584 [Penicillium canescens]